MTGDDFESCLAAYATPNGDNANGTDKNTTHAYGPLYSSIFGELRRSRTVRRVLELGVYSGASCRAFADFFPDARVDGVDITLANVRQEFCGGHSRIHLHRADATLESTAAEVLRAGADSQGSFDVILDDASHDPSNQVRSLEVFGGMLSADGVYVIEDINGAFVGDLRPVLERTGRQHGLAMEWHDLRARTGRFDDIVAVFRRRVAGRPL